MPASSQSAPFERTIGSPSDPGDDSADLRRLVQRIAADDRNAFAELFDRVSGPLSSGLRSQVPDPVRAAGIVAGTFVEVWWLAGCHVAADTDVLAWINEIVRRRVADSRSPGPGAPDSAAHTALWAQHSELELAELRGPAPSRARASHYSTVLGPGGSHDHRFR